MRMLTRVARRGAVFIVGIALVAAGVVMLAIPGPGIATILLGLVVLAREFHWARRVLAWMRRRAVGLKDQAQARMPGSSGRRPDTPPSGRDRPDRAA